MQQLDLITERHKDYETVYRYLVEIGCMKPEQAKRYIKDNMPHLLRK